VSDKGKDGVTINDRLSRNWVDHRNNQLSFWHESLKSPSFDLTFGALMHFYFYPRNEAAMIPPTFWNASKGIFTILKS
jgi:hypothetical protein